MRSICGADAGCLAINYQSLCLVFGAKWFGFRFSVFGFRVSGLGLRVWDPGFTHFVLGSHLPPVTISCLLFGSDVLIYVGLTGGVFGGWPVYLSCPMGMEEDQRLRAPLGTSQSSGRQSPGICHRIPRGVARCFFSGGNWVVLRFFVGEYV